MLKNCTDKVQIVFKNSLETLFKENNAYEKLNKGQGMHWALKTV